jgi:flagellar biosynthetic protein FliR
MYRSLTTDHCPLTTENMELQFPIAEVMRFVIVLTRLSGIMLCAPFYTGGYMPVHIRGFFAFVAALVLTPSLPLGNIPPGIGVGSIASILFFEILFGYVIGFTALCIFAGLQLGGQIIAFNMGYAMNNLVDPQTQVQMPIISFLLNYVGLLLFLQINGHHFFLLAVYESFTTLPIGGFVLNGPLVNQIAGFTASIFVIGIKIAGPIIVVIIVVDIIVGIIGRAAPQIHVLVVGMPLKILVGFATLSISLYFMPRYLESLFLSLSRTIHALAAGG